MFKKKLNLVFIGITLIFFGFLISILSIDTVRSQIAQKVGITVAQSPIQWNDVKDAAQGDNLTNGILASGIYAFDGVNWDRARATALADGNTSTAGLGTASFGFGFNGVTWDRILSSLHGDGLVAATYPRGINTASFGYMFNGATYDRLRGATATGLQVNVLTNTAGTAGTAFYAIKRDNITNAASVNLAFGFTAKKVIIETATTNTVEIVVDWIGGAAVIPAANAAGDDRIAAGRIVVFDDYAVTSISIIADGAANQTVYVRAFN